MARTLISTEALAHLRRVYRDLDLEAQRVETAARRVPRKLRDDVRRKFNRGADRALDQVAQAIPVPVLWREGRKALWRYLAPAPADRPGIAVRALTFDATGLPGLRTSKFALTATHHSLGRLIDRSNFAADPVQAVLQAHDALLALDPDEGTRLFALGGFLLPAHKGAFLLTSSPSDENSAPMSTAWTWVSDDMLYADQARYSTMWAQLIDAPTP